MPAGHYRVHRRWQHGSTKYVAQQQQQQRPQQQQQQQHARFMAAELSATPDFNGITRNS
jgi:transcription initiation factor TFIID subunit TAF12